VGEREKKEAAEALLIFRCAILTGGAMKLIFTCSWMLIPCAIFGVFAVAQEKTPAKPTLQSVLDNQLTSLEHDFVSAAEAMPEDKYAFAPSAGDFKGVRTFALQVRHVAFANHVFFGAVVGEKTPAGGDRNGPESLKSKEEILGYLRESFAMGHRAIAALTAENSVTLMENAPVPRFNTRLGMVTHACAHAYDHYGQMVEYLRMNGIVPPASRPSQ